VHLFSDALPIYPDHNVEILSVLQFLGQKIAENCDDDAELEVKAKLYY
jgi:hypothetical protein